MLALLKTPRLERDVVPDSRIGVSLLVSTATTRVGYVDTGQRVGRRRAADFSGPDAYAAVTRAIRRRGEGSAHRRASLLRHRRAVFTEISGLAGDAHRRPARRGGPETWTGRARRLVELARAAPPIACPKGGRVRPSLEPLRSSPARRAIAGADRRPDPALARPLRPDRADGLLFVQVQPFTFPDERRYFVCGSRPGAVVGFLGRDSDCTRGRGWFFEDFLRDPGGAERGGRAPRRRGNARAAAMEGIEYVTLGLGAARRRGRAAAARRAPPATRSTTSKASARSKRSSSPEYWDPIFAYPPGGSGIAAIFDTLRAFARGGLLRFGAQTLRGPAIVMRARGAARRVDRRARVADQRAMKPGSRAQGALAGSVSTSLSSRPRCSR